MRCGALVPGLLLLASPAWAQKVDVACPSAAAMGRVNVEVAGEPTITGTLFCLTADEVALLKDGEVVRTPLARVKRIHKPSDPTWDGFVKGAAIPLTLWGVICGFCGEAAPGMWRAAIGYGVIGSVFDALQSNSKTIYVGKQATGVQVRFSF